LLPAHFRAGIKVLAYLFGSSTWGLPLGGNMPAELISFVDSDWAGDHIDRKSTEGNILFYRGGPIFWQSRKIKSTVSLSSTEAEVNAMVDGMKSILHVRPILDEMVGGSIVKQPVVVGDNRPSVMILAGTTSSKRAKHFDTQGEICTRFGSVRQVSIARVRTAQQLADALTKPIPTPAFREFRSRVMADILGSGQDLTLARAKNSGI
jgi:hypothetical protein